MILIENYFPHFYENGKIWISQVKCEKQEGLYHFGILLDSNEVVAGFPRSPGKVLAKSHNIHNVPARNPCYVHVFANISANVTRKCVHRTWMSPCDDSQFIKRRL